MNIFCHIKPAIKSIIFACMFFTANTCAMSLQAYLSQTEAGNTKLTLIDIRAAAIYAQSHIPNAINIPAEIVARKRLPPLGKVVVYGDGVDQASAQNAVDLFNAKPGIDAELLEGGYAAWLSGQSVVQEKHGIEMHKMHFLGFHQLKKITAYDASVVLVDMRTRADKTDLSSLFGDVNIIHADSDRINEQAVLSAILSYAPEKNKYLFVLIDDGDGKAEHIVSQLHAASIKRIAILLGGEIALKTKGEVSETVQVFGKR